MSEDLDAAMRARRNAESQLHNVEGRWPIVRTLAAALRVERERNHFTERLQAVFRETY